MTPHPQTRPHPALRAAVTDALEAACDDLDEAVRDFVHAVAEQSADVLRLALHGADERELQFSRDMLKQLGADSAMFAGMALQARARLRWWTEGGAAGQTREARS